MLAGTRRSKDKMIKGIQVKTLVKDKLQVSPAVDRDAQIHAEISDLTSEYERKI